MNKDLRKLLKEVADQGFTWTATTKGHVQVRDTDGRIVAVFAGTASDWRSMKNGIAALKRAGFQPKR